MYAFIVTEQWFSFQMVNRSQDVRQFLQEVGTPALVGRLPDTGSSATFHSKSGFYVAIEDGWSVKYNPELAAVSQPVFFDGLDAAFSQLTTQG